MKIENFQEVQKVLIDLEKRVSALEARKTPKKEQQKETWYRADSATAKVVELIDEGFFNETRAMADLVEELKTKDYHLKVTSLTLPLRNIVRHKLLKKTRTRTDGSQSKKWLYVKV